MRGTSPAPKPSAAPAIRSANVADSSTSNNAIITDDPIFDHNLELITAGAQPFLKEHLLTKISRENCSIIVSYIMAMQTETDVSDNYRFDTINKLKQFAEFHKPKQFKELTRQDVLDFLDRLRKPE